MIVENRVYGFRAKKARSWLETVAEALGSRLEDDSFPLRWCIVRRTQDELLVEATLLTFDPDHRYADRLRSIELLEPRKRAFQASPFTVVQVVPTGIGCELGGYAGDACPATNLLASAADLVVTHPNAVNASDLNEMAGNVLYVEGRALDDFLLGHLGLLPTAQNRIGTFVDVTGLDYVDDVISSLDAARTARGIDCGRYTLLKEELGVQIEWSEAGRAVGTVANLEALFDGVEVLLDAGVDAVGGVSVIHGVTREMVSRYLRGEIPNPSGGIEAIITHVVSKIFRVPVAHAPLPYYRDLKDGSTRDPRAAAEFISTPHYFCVLKGLARAPRLVELSSLRRVPAQVISLNQVGAIVTPASCLGGVPALAAEFSGIPLIAVRENRTILDVTNSSMEMENAVEVESYLEAAGVVLALREGISLESLRRPIPATQRV